MANEPNEEEQPLLHAATYTQAPKVSHKVLTKEERQTLIKEHEAQQQEAAKLDEAASKGRIGRWWSRDGCTSGMCCGFAPSISGSCRRMGRI